MNCDKCGKEINRGMAGSGHVVNIIPHSKIGMRVGVVVEDDTPIYGTITNVEPLLVEETGYILSEHFPTIELDDGRIVNGMECYWYPVEEKKRKVIQPEGKNNE